MRSRGLTPPGSVRGCGWEKTFYPLEHRIHCALKIEKLSKICHAAMAMRLKNAGHSSMNGLRLFFLEDIHVFMVIRLQRCNRPAPPRLLDPKPLQRRHRQTLTSPLQHAVCAGRGVGDRGRRGRSGKCCIALCRRRVFHRGVRIRLPSAQSAGL